MQITLRSHLIAGIAAVVGAGAIAITPIAPHNLALPAIQVPSASAEVVLAGFDSPISALLETAALTTGFIFSADNTTYPFVPGKNLIQGSPYYFSAVGIIPQIINDHLPIISQLGYNGAAYLNSTLNAVTSIGYSLSEGVWNAAGHVLTLNFSAAVADLVGAVEAAGKTALAAGQYVLDNVVAKATALVGAVPALADLVVKSTIAQAKLLGSGVSSFVQDLITVIGQGDPETAWNFAVKGLFSPLGIPGNIAALTIGAGIQTGFTTVVPSIRGEIQAVVKGVATALATMAPTPPVPPPAAAKSAGPSPAAVRAAAVIGAAPTGKPAVAEEKSASASAEGSDASDGLAALDEAVAPSGSDAIGTARIVEPAKQKPRINISRVRTPNATATHARETGPAASSRASRSGQ